ncbi:MAG: Crp/Fnr family transcriptional regulator [Ferruginibacter sp.]
MQISEDILLAWGAVAKKYRKNELIFHEGEAARCYHQLIEGRVRMYSSTAEDKEFTQGMFEEGCSFGEPPLFIDEPYPANAVAIRDSVVLKLSKDIFLKILEEYPYLQMEFLQTFARRIYDKSIAAKDLINHSPEDRIAAFLEVYKKKTGSDKPVVVGFTRKEIANFTGLCVETVIRTLTKMEKKKMVAINNRKIVY